MTFDEWFDGHEWFHEDSRYNDFADLWDDLVDRGWSNVDIVEHLDRIISAMKDEYGE